MTTFVHSFSSRHLLCVDHEKYTTVLDLKHDLFHSEDDVYDFFFFVCNGSLVDDDEPVKPNVIYHTYLRLPGGKGGFGSMLRAIGAQIEKTTNHEACRDLSGRRMRDVNNEKDLKDWLGKQAEREQEKEQRRQERIARRRAMPNHKFEDPTYDQQRNLLSQNQEDAITKGLQKTSTKSSATATVTSETVTGGKRKIETATSSSAAKKRKDTEWLGVDMDDLSDMDSDEDNVTAGACALPGPNTDSDSNPSSEEAWALQSGTSTSDMVEPGTSKSDTVSMSVTSQSEDEPGTFKIPNLPVISISKDSPCSGSSEKLGSSDKGENENGGAYVSEDTVDCSKVENPQKEEEKEAEQDKTKPDTESSNCSGTENTSEATSTEKQEDEPFNLDTVTSVAELAALGLDRLKAELMGRGLKCGGTLDQRAERLWSVKGLAPEDIDPALFAKSNGKNGKKKK